MPDVQNGIRLGAAQGLTPHRGVATFLREIIEPRRIIIQPAQIIDLVVNVPVLVSYYQATPTNGVKGTRCKLDIVNVGAEPVVVNLGQSQPFPGNYHYPLAACSQNGTSASTTDNGTGGAVGLDWARVDVYVCCRTGAGKISVVEARFPTSK